MTWLSAMPALADPNENFLAALREAGYHDTATDYVDWVEKSPLLTEEFRTRLPYERALSLAAQGRSSRNRQERATLLEQAASRFAEFASADPTDPATLDALRQAANLWAELALTTLNDAKLKAGAAADAHRQAALAHFDHATQAGDQLLEICTEQLADLPKPTVAMADADVKAKRDRLVDRQVEARYLLALLSFERAAAFEAGSDDHNDALDDAWAQFGALVEQYRENTVVGTSSRFYQGRCAQEQGEFARALGCYEDIVNQPPGRDEFRAWTARAYRRQAECLIELEKLDEAVRQCEKWLAASSAEEREKPEWLEVTYQLATALQRQLDEKAVGGNAAKRIESQLRDIYRTVADHPNELQLNARRALAGAMQRPDGEASFKNFADALTGGKTALEVMNSSLLAVKVARENNPEAVEELEREAAASKSTAQLAFETAIDLADKQTPIAELNTARYYLAWLYWEADRIHEAAVLGEFVASRYPESEFGPGAAKIALAAWEKVYRESRSSGEGAAVPGEFAGTKLAELAQLIATRWPDTPEAASAVAILINVALRSNRVEQAEELLAKLPEDARSGAQLSLGSALWTQYLEQSAGRENDFDAASLALRDKAGQLLTSGFAGLPKDAEPSTSAAVGSLYLVQLLLAQGDWQEALAALQHETVGPLTLVEAKAPVAARPEFVLETYKAALRVFLSTQPPQREQAQAMMRALEKFVEQNEGDAADEQLTRVYVGLGLQLQRQVKELTAAGNHLQAQQVAAAFGDLLDRVAARPDAGDWTIRNWVAQTNLQIGQGLRGDEAVRYLQRARDAYQSVLDAASKGGADAPDANTVLAVRKRLGDCLIALGEFENGIGQYAELLRAKPAMLDVQQAAATAYQAWGVAAKTPAPLELSIHGAIPQAGGKNLIWGWLRISTAADGARRRAAAEAASDPAAAKNAERFTDLFFEARYNIAKSRFLGATFAPAQSRRAQLDAAKQNVESMRSLYPDLGGPKWKAAFEALLVQINQELAKG